MGPNKELTTNIKVIEPSDSIVSHMEASRPSQGASTHPSGIGEKSSGNLTGQPSVSGTSAGGSASGTGAGGSGSGTGSEFPSALADEITQHTKEFTEDFVNINQLSLRKYERLNNTRLSLELPEFVEPFWIVIKHQADMVIKSVHNRFTWVENMTRVGITSNTQEKLDLINSNLDNALNEYLSKVDELSEGDGDIQSKLKEMYNATNAYRNRTYKDLNKAEELVKSDFREGPLYKSKILKELVNKKYPDAKKSFITADDYLRKKISEVLNAKKK